MCTHSTLETRIISSIFSVVTPPGPAVENMSIWCLAEGKHEMPSEYAATINVQDGKPALFRISVQIGIL